MREAAGAARARLEDPRLRAVAVAAALGGRRRGGGVGLPRDGVVAHLGVPASDLHLTAHAIRSVKTVTCSRFHMKWDGRRQSAVRMKSSIPGGHGTAASVVLFTIHIQSSCRAETLAVIVAQSALHSPGDDIRS